MSQSRILKHLAHRYLDMDDGYFSHFCNFHISYCYYIVIFLTESKISLKEISLKYLRRYSSCEMSFHQGKCWNCTIIRSVRVRPYVLSTISGIVKRLSQSDLGTGDWHFQHFLRFHHISRKVIYKHVEDLAKVSSSVNYEPKSGFDYS